MIIGRDSEIQELKAAFESEYSEFVVVYGRRRVGKTFLIRETFDYTFTFQHSGVANVTKREQIKNFVSSLRKQGMVVKRIPKTWFEVFDLLEEFLEKSPDKKKRVFLDEVPWMDSQKSNFVSALEHFWNNWASARKDVLLIVCGSATSWIMKNIVKNKRGLHNRLTHRIKLPQFTLAECEEYAEYRKLGYSREMILETYMALGGIPYYWSLLQPGLSVSQNIDKLMFSESGKLRDEFDELYASLFKNSETYMDVVSALGEKKLGLTRKEITESLGAFKNGHLQKILKDLEWCGFIRSYKSYGKKTKDVIYQLIDHYTLFYFRFIKNLDINDEAFWTNTIGQPVHTTWCGLAFERVCLCHIPQIKAKLGISGVLTNYCAWKTAADEELGIYGTQIDLLLDRKDNIINICEMKYSSDEYVITKDYDTELRRKKNAFKVKTKTRKALHITLVTTYGVHKNMYSGNIQSQVTMDDLFVK